jgi:hypothetical protein
VHIDEAPIPSLTASAIVAAMLAVDAPDLGEKWPNRRYRRAEESRLRKLARRLPSQAHRLSEAADQVRRGVVMRPYRHPIHA